MRGQIGKARRRAVARRAGKIGRARHPLLQAGIEEQEEPIDGDVADAPHERQERARRRRTVSRSFASMFRNAILAATSSALKHAVGRCRCRVPQTATRRCWSRPNPCGTSLVPGESGTSMSRRIRSSPSTFSGTPDEIQPPHELPGGTMARGGKREAVHLPGIERQLQTELDGGRFGLPLIQEPRPAGGEHVRHADLQRTAAPEVPIAAVEDRRSARFSVTAPPYCATRTNAPRASRNTGPAPPVARARRPAATPAPPRRRREAAASSGTRRNRRRRVARPETRTPPAPRPRTPRAIHASPAESTFRLPPTACWMTGTSTFTVGAALALGAHDDLLRLQHRRDDIDLVVEQLLQRAGRNVRADAAAP